MKNFLLALSTLFAMASCSPDDDGGPSTPSTSDRKAYIGVEGISPNGISSLVEYDITNQSINNNLYRKQNQAPMGSVLRHFLLDEDNNVGLFILAGSEIISVVNLDNFKLQRTVRDVDDANYVAKVDNNRYYVSTGTNRELVTLQGSKFNTGMTVPTGVNPGQILVDEDMAFVVNRGTVSFLDSTMTIVRTSADTVIETVFVGHNPNSMVIDNDNILWVLSSGQVDRMDPTNNGVGLLQQFNLDTMRMAIDSGWAIEPDTAFAFTDNQLRPNKLTYSPNTRQLYYIGGIPTGDIFSMTLLDNSVSETPIKEGAYYGLGFDDVNNELYGLRTPSSNIDGDGHLEILETNGAIKNSFRIGPRPTHVEFR